MGRKQTPTAIKKLSGNPGKRRLNKSEPTPALGRPQCPEGFEGEARAEWDRICDELDQMGLLTTADRTVLALYCESWALWRKAKRQVKAEGELIVSSKGGMMHNPWLSVANKAQDQVRQLMSEIGLTAAARAKMTAPADGNGDDAGELEI